MEFKSQRLFEREREKERREAREGRERRERVRVFCAKRSPSHLSSFVICASLLFPSFVNSGLFLFLLLLLSFEK